MGITSTDIPLLEALIKNYDIKSVIELGAQQNYAQPNLPAPYMSEWYKQRAIQYTSVDISGENKALKGDLGVPIFLTRDILPQLHPEYNAREEFDLVTDFGTSEHVGTSGAFNWEAIYNCWRNKFNFSKVNGIIISENPKTGNWPGHGFQWYTKEFYRQLEATSGLKILSVDDEICAMGNCTTGKNVLCVMQKTRNKFPDLETFKTFDLRQS